MRTPPHTASSHSPLFDAPRYAAPRNAGPRHPAARASPAPNFRAWKAARLRPCLLRSEYHHFESGEYPGRPGYVCAIAMRRSLEQLVCQAAWRRSWHASACNFDGLVPGRATGPPPPIGRFDNSANPTRMAARRFDISSNRLGEHSAKVCGGEPNRARRRRAGVFCAPLCSGPCRRSGMSRGPLRASVLRRDRLTADGGTFPCALRSERRRRRDDHCASEASGPSL